MIISQRALAAYEANRQLIERRWSGLVPPAPSTSVPATQDPTAIPLGTSGETAISLALRARAEHMLVIGGSGGGKSRFVFLYLIEAIRRGEGVIFLDPHGSFRDSVAKQLLEWLERGGYFGKRKVTFINFDSKEHIIGFNPLTLWPNTHPSVIVEKVQKATSIIWAEEQKRAPLPTLERVFSISLYALIALGLTAAELPMLLDREDKSGLRRHALKVISDPVIHGALNDIHTIAMDGRRVREYQQEIVGPLNRIIKLLFCEQIRYSLGQTANTLDLRAAMDNGEIIIADVSETNQVSGSDAELYARLLIHEVMFHALRRTNLRPFNLVIDEASRVFSSDLPKALAQMRKFGVALVAGLQWIGQAIEYDPSIAEALLNGCGTKIVFKQNSADDSELLARTVVPLNLEKPVDILTKPTVVGHRIRQFANESDSTTKSLTRSKAIALGESEVRTLVVAETDIHMEGVAEGESEIDAHSVTKGIQNIAAAATSAATFDGSAESVGLSVHVGDGIVHDDTVSPRETHGKGNSKGDTAGSSSSKGHGKTENTGDTTAHGRTKSRISTDAHGITVAEGIARGTNRTVTEGEAIQEGSANSRGYSEGLEPILEDRPTSVHSLPNMIHMAAEKLRGLQTGTAFISNSNMAALFHVTPMLTPPVNQEAFPALRDRIMAQGNGAVPMQDAVKAIAARHHHLRATLPPPPTPPKAAYKNTKAKAANSNKPKPSTTRDEPDDPKGTWGGKS